MGNLILLHANNKGADQPVHLLSVICYLDSIIIYYMQTFEILASRAEYRFTVYIGNGSILGSIYIPYRKFVY